MDIVKQPDVPGKKGSIELMRFLAGTILTLYNARLERDVLLSIQVEMYGARGGKRA